MRRSPFLVIVATLFFTASPFRAQRASADLLAPRFRALDKTMESAPPAQRLAWNALLVAFTTFRDARLREICSGAHGCRETLPIEKSAIDAGFLDQAEGHTPEGLPPFTASELTTADAALNMSFERSLQGLAETCSGQDSGCLSQQAFRNIQRDWIRYRDAWVTFAALRWPQIAPESWLTLLTRKRTVEINLIAKPTP